MFAFGGCLPVGAKTSSLSVKLNGSRQINGILRGFDPFMNLVIDEAVEINKRNQQVPIGMVVVRGNAVVLLESLDRIA